MELYNLKTDPSEERNVAAQNPRVVAQFGQYLKTARTHSPRFPNP